jgi:hypothetical protein
MKNQINGAEVPLPLTPVSREPVKRIVCDGAELSSRSKYTVFTTL